MCGHVDLPRIGSGQLSGVLLILGDLGEWGEGLLLRSFVWFLLLSRGTKDLGPAQRALGDPHLGDAGAAHLVATPQITSRAGMGERLKANGTR